MLQEAMGHQWGLQSLHHTPTSSEVPALVTMLWSPCFGHHALVTMLWVIMLLPGSTILLQVYLYSSVDYD